MFGARLLDLAEETDLLRKIPMFAKMETSKLKLLAFASEMVSFQDGDIVFNNGDTADYAYVIMEGAVDIITETEKKSRRAKSIWKRLIIRETA